ncbi:MAG: glycoside-pentoside-hexuronide (GPH):cation symporter [Streptosporangiaceae bacterium]
MRPLTRQNYAGYAAGDFANNLAFSMQGLFLMIYYTNVIGLDPAIVATMFLLVRFWDAFSDVGVGRIVDLTRTRWGKFRPYLLVASLPLLFASVAVFSMPGFGGDRGKQYLYMYVSYIVLGTLYSFVNIPYGSLATAMTQDPIERSRLGAWRSAGPVVAILVLVLVISPKITQYKTHPGQLQSFLTATTLAFVAVGFLAYLFTFFSCREQAPHKAQPVTMKDTLRTVKQNRVLQILCVSNFVYLIGVFGVQGAEAYYAAYVLGNSADLIPIILASSAATFVAVPVVPLLVARIGKKATFMGATGIMVAAGIWIFFLPVQLSLVVVVFFIFGLGQGTALSLMFAFEADAVEYGEYQTGQRTEGATYAIYSFSRKMSQALAASLVGYALAIGRFVPKAPAQPHSAVEAIKVVVGLAPAVFGLAGIAIFAFYPLTDDRFRQIVKELRARAAEQLVRAAATVAPESPELPELREGTGVE